MIDTLQLTELTCKTECVKLCDEVLSDLPDWFGPFEVYKDYLEDVKTRPVFVAEIGREKVGLMALTQTSAACVDIHLLAIRSEHHGAGIGRAFVELAKRYAKERGAGFLTVKTLGPSRENAAYAKTRKFYASVGFEPLEEFIDFWGKDVPMLLQCQRVV
ncbi:Acetyltransferase (GNAT) domain-containing protein [Pseudovibrio denitrificans]|uniref:Acetyltransferase (GNAT) domain-containing protein n=1 Tax=Pseudovibrio denitrificans TaxID=258256 RepID=A0A1I7DA25_9HYPH|nr:GNAT family N-acetyltransferase [Pseudovibrio denitrificans]SFU08529.1 Acetyltransferase (GNAT) domain-containing protein [Pseudovibrio denitrificans]